MEIDLPTLINTLQIGDIAKASFAISEEWYVTKRSWDEAIVYCDQNGHHNNEVIPLTRSNLRAWYKII